MNVDNQHTLPVMCIGIMTYNHSHFIEDALQAAISQDYTGKYYIIVSDDCSKDDTFKKIQNFALNHAKCNWIIGQTPFGGGVSINERNLYELTPDDADVIVISEGDDVSTKDRLSVLANYLQQYPQASLIGSNVHFIKGDNYYHTERDVNDKCVLYEADVAHNSISLWGCTRVYRRILVEAYPLMSSRVQSTDVVWNLRAMMLEGMLIIPECLLYYRLHENQLTSAINNKKIDRWPIFIQMHTDVIWACCKRYINFSQFVKIIMHVDHYGIAALLNKSWIWRRLREKRRRN